MSWHAALRASSRRQYLIVSPDNLPVARAVSDAALEIHPENPLLLDRSSQVLEAQGDLASARARAARCPALEAPDDWRATAAISRCRALAARLRAA